MRTELVLRFDCGRSIPWVREHFGGLVAIAGPSAVQFITPVELRGTPEMTTVGELPRREARGLPRATQLNLVTGNSTLPNDQAMPLLGVWP